MKKSKIDWPKEFEGLSESGLSQHAYCQKRGIKYTAFRYHWARRKNGFVEIPRKLEAFSASVDFFTFKIDGSGKAHFQINLQLDLGQWN
ncbi:hypothetical protein M9Y82_17120 [Leptospira weilii]|uniref:IS66 family insertion sequence element accessory protein TnpA n=1 Tax=Leptospira weilii TaxID=28184 RepID=UPI0002486301|nr:hypothetical protein [Leptospira weilii]MCL8268319.1 hypothetical protein [Leptospira weilii]